MSSTKLCLLPVRRVVCLLGALITIAGGTGRAMAAEDVITWNARMLDVLAVSGQIGPVQTRSLAMAH